MLSQDQLSKVLAALPDPTFVLSRSGRYLAVYGGSDARYYHDGAHLVGQTIGDVLCADKAAWFLNEIEQALASKQLQIVEYELSGKDIKGAPDLGPQTPIWFEGRIQALDFRIGGEDAVLWVASNITMRHGLEAQLTTLSETDELTGLRNRRHFDRIATAELARAARYQSPLSLAIFDIDHFKVINDTAGHKAGDSVLIEVAQLVGAIVRESDLVARWGGEEFTILMPQTKLDAAADAAEKIRRRFEEHAFPHGFRVTISVGVAEWAAPESIDGLILRADEALYLAKDSGRNQVVACRPEAAEDAAALRATPPTLIWRKVYESGDALIDAEHRVLFEGAGALIAHLRQQEPGAGHQQLLLEIDRLLAQATTHFAHEEEKLAELGWAGLAEHRQEHRDLLRRAAELHARLQTDRSERVAAEVITFLTIDVIANHMLRSDRQFYAAIGGSERLPATGGNPPGGA